MKDLDKPLQLHSIISKNQGAVIVIAILIHQLHYHVYQNSVQQVVSGDLAGECLQTGFERHCLTPQRAPLDTAYPLREHLNFLPELCGEVVLNVPTSKLCAAALALQNRAPPKGKRKAQGCQEKGRKRGGQQGGKKERRRRDIRSDDEHLAAQCEIRPLSRNTFRDSIAEGGDRTLLPCFHRVLRQYR